MDSIDYFEKNKDKIFKTAEFLCKKDSSCTVEDKFEELKSQYYNEDGSHHNETIMINNSSLNIKSWLDSIRHEPVENFLIIAIYNNTSSIIYKVVGDQFSSHNINLDEIDKIIVNMLTLKGIKSMGIYIVHNHPFIYKATPSPSDCETINGIYGELNNIEINANAIGIKCQIKLIDFSIVTEFDYWSMKQTDTN